MFDNCGHNENRSTCQYVGMGLGILEPLETRLEEELFKKFDLKLSFTVNCQLTDLAYWWQH